MRVFVWIVSGALLVVLQAAPAWAHSDNCIIAVHAGGTQIHPGCG
jgi:hypothetical protein